MDNWYPPFRGVVAYLHGSCTFRYLAWKHYIVSKRQEPIIQWHRVTLQNKDDQLHRYECLKTRSRSMCQGRRDTLLGQQTLLRVNDWEDRGSIPGKVQSSFIRYRIHLQGWCCSRPLAFSFSLRWHQQNVSLLIWPFIRWNRKKSHGARSGE